MKAFQIVFDVPLWCDVKQPLLVLLCIIDANSANFAETPKLRFSSHPSQDRERVLLKLYIMMIQSVIKLGFFYIIKPGLGHAEMVCGYSLCIDLSGQK